MSLMDTINQLWMGKIQSPIPEGMTPAAKPGPIQEAAYKVNPFMENPKATPDYNSSQSYYQGQAPAHGLNSVSKMILGDETTPTPTPTPQPKQQILQKDFEVEPGINKAMNYIRQNTPQGQDPMEYYPALKDPSFVNDLLQADKKRPGVANLMLLAAFHESTLGRNGNNLFGVIPGGEGSGRTAAFQSPSQALDYQLGPNVLGGGANPNMNIMGEQGPLTAKRIIQLYKSYNPEGAYINDILQALK